ncbi:MAG TPA: SDR family oxidoreductase [Burkholderiales bacterium]|nr:SDR family oxidoreductase [Burkholderiales bacterium]
MRRLLIIGCGDVGLRLIPLARPRYRVYALTRDAKQCASLRALGVTPVAGDLDHPQSLSAIAGIAHDVVHLAPPPSQGVADTRTAHLIAALGKRRNKNSCGSLPQHFVYISTSGVYGDCGGDIVPETRPAHPQTARALRRMDAEQRLRAWGVRSGVQVSILRVPGIYAADRLPLARLERGTPALLDADDSYVNHVHADDLARMVIAALNHASPGRAYNAVDDLPQKMGEYFDLVADRHGLKRPPRVARDEAQRVIPENLRSFMSESRRLTNQRIKQELRFRLRYPSVLEGIGLAPGKLGT